MALRRYVSQLTAVTLFFAAPALARAVDVPFESVVAQTSFKFTPDPFSSRLLLLDMQLNALRTIQVTMEGLNRLGAADAPGPGAGKLLTLLDAACAEQQALKTALAKDGTGSYEALVILARKISQMQALSEELAQAQAWGARDIAQTAAGMAEQVGAIRVAQPDPSLTPRLKARKHSSRWQAFVDGQNTALARYEAQLGRGELKDEDLRSLVAGRRDLAGMWELSH